VQADAMIVRDGGEAAEMFRDLAGQGADLGVH
jgi:hypothetical protein